MNYQEKYFASGRIPGGFFKREGRPTERETLLSRLIDRPIRPLFVDGFKNEVQVIITVLSWDNENDPDMLAMVAASAALTISGVPFMGPIAASRVGWIDGKPQLNPTIEQMKTSELDLVVAGTANAIMMVESEVKELSEAQMLEALALAHKGMQPVIDAIIELAEKAGKEPFEFDPPDHSGAEGARSSSSSARISPPPTRSSRRTSATTPSARSATRPRPRSVKSDTNPDGVDANVFKEVFKEVESDIVRARIVKEKGRIDGRAVDKVRPIECDGRLPAAHARLGAVHPR